jgi:Trk-type K+ transport system membrane component
VDFSVFEATNGVYQLNDPTVTSIPAGLRVLDGLFQAVSTRTSGTAVVNLSNLHPGIQVSYLIMMYISVYPIAISVRRTNVYEEKSLGIYESSQEEVEDEKEPSYVGAHLRKQLSFDLWFIFLGLFIVACVEGTRLQTDPGFSLFACLFEIVSAYGTVGLSLGYPNINASLSTEFSVVSKLVIVAMMIRGRHRGLPYELDRAILLPSESLHKKEDEDAARRNRRPSTAGGDDRRSEAEVAVDGLFETSPRYSRPVSSQRFNSGSLDVVHHHHRSRNAIGQAMAALAKVNPKS